MKKTLIAIMAALVFTVPTQCVLAQFNTFTSGGPPLGDGNDYPRSLNPARQSGGGASVDTFFSATVGFTNVNGNPAFFDSNNLLTRPAALINGDAFWTDPRLGNFETSSGTPFSIAQFGFEFYDNGFDSFGFDLAVASGSGPVPTSLPFQIQDFDSDAFGFGSLVLDPNQGGEFDEIFPSNAGTFFTIGGRQGREARYRIERFEIEDIIGESLSGGTWFFDIDLEGIATLGGTTQVAIDNFVLDSATLPMPTREPVYLPPTPPIGPNRPQYFNYAETTNDQSDGDPYDLTDEELQDLLVNLFIAGSSDIIPAIGEVNPRSTSITFDGNSIDNGLSGHEVTYIPSAEVSASEAMEGLLIFAAEFLPQLINNLPRFDQRNAPLPQIIDVLSLLELTSDIALDQAAEQYDEMPAILEFEVLEQGFLNEIVPIADDTSSDQLQLLTSGAEDSQSTTASIVAAAVSPEAMFYLNYTVDDYLALKESLNEPWYEGDAGSFVTPLYDGNGEILTFSVSTWTVSSQSGIFVPVILGAQVPEPGSLALLLLGVVATTVRLRSTTKRA